MTAQQSPSHLIPTTTKPAYNNTMKNNNLDLFIKTPTTRIPFDRDHCNIHMLGFHIKGCDYIGGRKPTSLTKLVKYLCNDNIIHIHCKNGKQGKIKLKGIDVNSPGGTDWDWIGDKLSSNNVVESIYIDDNAKERKKRMVPTVTVHEFEKGKMTTKHLEYEYRY